MIKLLSEVLFFKTLKFKVVARLPGASAGSWCSRACAVRTGVTFFDCFKNGSLASGQVLSNLDLNFEKIARGS